MDTTANAVNDAGTIVGEYSDANGSHGFIRAADGALTTFDVPGAENIFGVPDVYNPTHSGSINAAGTVSGLYPDARHVNHGFLRAVDETITTFDAPGAGTETRQGTYANSINSSGAIAGAYLDVGNTWHGFVRAPDGTMTTIELPHDPYGGVYLSAINTAGHIAGSHDAVFNIGALTRGPFGFVLTP